MSAATETRTFLFTDVEGSTRIAQELGDEGWHELLAVETRLVVGAAEAEGGRAFGSEGDAHFLVLPSVGAAIRAAAGAQRALAGHSWPPGAEVRVRMGIHTGDVLRVGDGFAGITLHRVARIAAAGHGGQVLVSATSSALASSALGELGLRDLGEHRLKDLAQPERIAQLTGSGLVAEFPALRTLDRSPNNLPTQLTTFVGRAEIALAQGLLAATRLLTLTGPGGTGKTRLSIALASEALADHPDGVWFVPLAPVTDPGLVAPAIATAVGLTPDPTRPPLDGVIAHFRDRRALLVLDNFEQVVDAAPVVADLLRAAPNLRIIVSSRAPLRISGEQEFAVPPLSIPAAGAEHDPERLMASEAVRLFVERAMAVRPDLALNAENGPAIADIVRRLDGLPLAIELAAARVRILSPAAIATRLDDRLALLVGGARDLPARQRTLRGAIEWSHDLLDETQRRLFARLGVFVGSGRLDTAEVVCGPGGELGIDIIDATSSLAEQSLVRVVEDVHADTRFVMLETIREFAGERLEARGEGRELRERHARAFLELAREMAAGLYGSERRVWLDRFEEDHDNVRAALAWRIAEGDCTGACELLAAVWRFWQARGHVDEGRTRTAVVLAMPSWPETPLAARIGSLEVAGGLAYWAGDLAMAHAHYREQVRLARELGDPSTVANALYNLAFAPRAVTGDEDWSAALRDDSHPFLEEALAIWRELDDEPGIARGLWVLGESRLFQRDLEGADQAYSEAIDLFVRQGDDFGAAWAYFTRGIARGESDPGTAKDDFREAFVRFRRAGDLPGIAFVAQGIGALLRREGAEADGHRLVGIGVRLREVSGAQLGAIAPPGWYLWKESDLNDPVVAAAWHEGHGLDRDAAIEVIGDRLGVPVLATGA